MFTNIGKKIKVLAKVLCWIGIALSVVAAIIFFVFSDADYLIYLPAGFACLFLGPLLSWIASFVLYGFGELVDTNCILASKYEKRD